MAHNHKWAEVNETDELTSEQTKSISDYDLLLTKIMILLGHYNLSFSVIESQIFWDLLEHVFKLGQKKPKIDPSMIIKKPSHSKLRDCFINTAKNFHESQLKAYSQINSVALTLDGGTIQYGHFLDFAISSPLFNLKPYLFEADFMADNTTEYIKSKTEDVLTQLLRANIKIKSITGDNYPAQLYALSSWSKTALWRTTTNSEIKKIIYFPCFCHTLQLIATDVEDDPQISLCVSILQKVKDCINTHLYKKTGKVPDEVDTRWFSHFNSLKFILANTNLIFEAKDELLKSLSTVRESSSKAETDALHFGIQKDEFSMLSKYADIMIPIYSATLFFESNTSKVTDIVPIVFQIEKHWNNLLKDETFTQFYNTIDFLLERLKHRKFHLLDWPLLHLAYSFTPGGRIFARKILKKYQFEINDDKFDNSPGLDPSIRLKLNELGYKIKLKQITNEATDPMNSDSISIDRNEDNFESTYNDANANSITSHASTQKNLVFMVGNVESFYPFNTNRSIDDTKLFPFERKMEDIEFQYEPGHFLLLKTTLTELIKRLGYEKYDKSILACYDYWIKNTIADLKINRYSKENSY